MKNHRLRKYTIHFLLFTGLAIIISACGSGGNEPQHSADNISGNTGNSLSLRVAVPDTMQDEFCARFEISGPGLQTIVVEDQYPAGSKFIDAVLTDIPEGNKRMLVLGLFEQRKCGDMDSADWIGSTGDILVNAGEVTRVSLNLENMTTGTIIVNGTFEQRELHGEVVDSDGVALAEVKCEIFEEDDLAGSTLSSSEAGQEGVLDTVVDVKASTQLLHVSCEHDGFNPQTAVAKLRGSPNGFMIFGVTVEMRKHLSAPSIVVDRSLRVKQDDLPPISANGKSRPVAAMQDERGNVAHFSENELILTSNDMDAVEAFVGDWNGELLATIDFEKTGIDARNLHLIRIDTSLADTSKLMDDLKALDGAIRGSHHVSSEAGLALIAAGANAASSGMEVGMNWIGEGDSINSGSTAESTTGPNGFTAGGSYSPDAFDWTYMDSGSTQDIGVAPAWRLLSNLGHLTNRQRLAILDMGFVPIFNGDVATDFIARSNVPFTSAIGTSNLGSCGGPCPWHGTNVTNAAMGLVDNNIGAAGPGGPVARPVLVFTLYDFFTSMSAVTIAYADGARIMNMSYGAKVPAIVSWSVLPFEAVTTAFNAAGAIMTASAGNSGENVDAEDCGPFGLICWEENWHTPCENRGVMCVGGLGVNSKNRAGNSSFGNRQVDIFAPYTMLVGRDQSGARLTEQAYAISGTSFSAPFVAGVAALVKAANPSLSGREIQRILERTAHSSPDPRVRRYVNALAAVRDALGTAVNIISPTDGASVARGRTINFRAEAFSNEHSNPSFEWRSSRQGVIGTGPSMSRIDLALGIHTITVEATFDDGFAVTDSIRLTIINTPPTVFIDSPASGQRYSYSEPILLRGRSIDTSSPETGFRLLDSQVRWVVNGIYAGSGHTRTFAGSRLPVGGPYTVRFIGSDGSSTVDRSTTIFIDPDPSNRRPVVTITQPANNATFLPNEVDSRGLYVDITVSWTANDPEDGFLSFADTRWTTRINGGPEQPLTVTEIVISHPSLPISFSIFKMRLYAPQSFNNAHDIRLRATDSDGATGESTIRVNVTNLS